MTSRSKLVITKTYQKHWPSAIKSDYVYRKIEITVQKSARNYDVLKCSTINDYKIHLLPLLSKKTLHAYKFLLYGAFEYRPGLMLVSDKKILEIIHIFYEDDKAILLCQKYKQIQFDYNLNSIEIVREKKERMIKLFAKTKSTLSLTLLMYLMIFSEVKIRFLGINRI